LDLFPDLKFPQKNYHKIFSHEIGPTKIADPLPPGNIFPLGACRSFSFRLIMADRFLDGLPIANPNPERTIITILYNSFNTKGKMEGGFYENSMAYFLYGSESFSASLSTRNS